MSIRNFKFWNAVPVTPNVADTRATADWPDARSNVVQLPLGSTVDAPASLASKMTGSAQPCDQSAQKVNTSAAMMAAFELQEFFASNFIGLGRHNGSHYKTKDAQTQSKATLVSQFQNAVVDLVIFEREISTHNTVALVAWVLFFTLVLFFKLMVVLSKLVFGDTVNDELDSIRERIGHQKARDYVEAVTSPMAGSRTLIAASHN